MLDLASAIKQCTETAKEVREQPFKVKMDIEDIAACEELAEEQEQLAGWLTELQERREADRWMPVSERLPNRNGCYIVTRIVEETPLSDVCYFDGQNTWHSDNRVNHGRPYLTDVIAWKPLPKPYESEDKND